jgi:hypothetical protein
MQVSCSAPNLCDRSVTGAMSLFVLLTAVRVMVIKAHDVYHMLLHCEFFMPHNVDVYYNNAVVNKI